jgi:hypothetical protein
VGPSSPWIIRLLVNIHDCGLSCEGYHRHHDLTDQAAQQAQPPSGAGRGRLGVNPALAVACVAVAVVQLRLIATGPPPV